MKRMIAAALAALMLAAALTACGSRDNGAVSTTPGGNVNGGTVPAPAPVEPEHEGTAREEFDDSMEEFKDGAEDFGDGLEQGAEDMIDGTEKAARRRPNTGTGMVGER